MRELLKVLGRLLRNGMVRVRCWKRLCDFRVLLLMRRRLLLRKFIWY